MIIESFPPIADNHAVILILGSIPGIKSLQANEYYAHPQNQFWKILYRLFDCQLDKAYSLKISFLKTHRIALWDVIKQCERKGSLDSQIVLSKVNDFDSFFFIYPSIQAIFFNGAKARESFRKHIGFHFNQIKSYQQLPSTSPARTISFEDKYIAWKKILQWL